MREITLNLSRGDYKIIVGHNILDTLPIYLKALDIGNRAIIITNGHIAKLYAAELVNLLGKAGIGSCLIKVADTEKAKSLVSVERISSKILDKSKYKEPFLISLGGGVIGDLTGFTAGIYKRGIPYIHLPTTLLAQIDSSIGGKTAVNIDKAKNILGLFYQPKLVISELKFLQTLPGRYFWAGFAEIVKYAIIKDKRLFRFLEDHISYPDTIRREELEYIIYRCIQIKKEIVEQDEYDNKDRRIILNFGHTLGHALEASLGYKRTIAHYCGVSMGMVYAGILSVILGLAEESTLHRIKGLLHKLGLPINLPRSRIPSPGEIIALMRYDKKIRRGVNRFVLLRNIGDVCIYTDIKETLLREAIDRWMSLS